MAKMNDNTFKRLNTALRMITDPGMLSGEGLGNETPFHIFDYPPQDEIQVRKFIADKLLPRIENQHPEIRPLNVNLFQMIIDYLKEEDYYDALIELQESGDNETLTEFFDDSPQSQALSDLIADQQNEQNSNLILMHGAGGCWNMLRLQALLSNLQTKPNIVPLVLFFPGTYTETGLKMFDEFKEDGYYRAFKLVP